MALTPKLEIRQSQSLLMTPQLRQAINLLQLSNLELNELLEQELNNNPLLEREDDVLEQSPQDLPHTIDEYDSSTPQEEDYSPDIDYDNDFSDDYGSDREGYEQENETSWNEYYQSKKNHDDEDFDYFEKKLSSTKSLNQLLDEQITLVFLTEKERFMARLLSEQLDNAGYFRGNITDLASKLQTSSETLQQILNRMKEFEPTGIFAENLAECLKLQLQEQNRFDPAIENLLNNLDLLATRKFKELKKICNVDDEDLQEMISDIKSLNPKPTADYYMDNPAYIIPDVFVRRLKDGSYHVEINNASLPRLLINREYAEHISSSNKNKETKKFVKNSISHANFIVKALHQRTDTILRVATEIVRWQRDFFEYGIDNLKPMNLKDIAYQLEMHESTVSRATTGKYMHTPKGLFELKYFFSSAASTYNGDEDTSTLSIKHKIKQLIENETPQNILSDDNIVELLAQQSIKIARRTVAKYRESMGLPTSAERKRQKRS